MMKPGDLNKALESIGHVQTRQIKITDDFSIDVKQYLPIEQKAELIQFVIDNSLNPQIGCCSPIQVEMYFAMAVIHYYCDIDFEGENLIPLYDLYESTGFINQVFNAIPTNEIEFIQSKTDETISDVTRYANSFAGIVQNMSADASQLDATLRAIVERIRGSEGREIVNEIENAVGTD